MSDFAAPSAHRISASANAAARLQYAADVEAVRRKLMRARPPSRRQLGRLGVAVALLRKLADRLQLAVAVIAWGFGGLLLTFGSLVALLYWMLQADIA